jgi:hypothetical protein
MYLSPARILCVNELYREPIRIHDVETDTTFFVLWSDSLRLQIRGHGFLAEVFDSDGDMVDLAPRLTWPQDQKVFSKHYLVVPLPLVHSATQNALVEIS